MIKAKKRLKMAQKWVTEIVFAFVFKPFFEAVFSKISIVKPPIVVYLIIGLQRTF